jgi:O-methyltransferase involved in polyketide biosynthesis
MISSTKIQTTSLEGVAETLMITLYARVIESRRSDPILVDAKAVEIAERVEYDFSKYESGWASQLGCMLRVREIDRLVTAFLSRYPNALVVNLGAGLCTRFFRVQCNKAHWYDIDLPEVVDLKQCLVPEGDRYHYISRSLLDFEWINRIPLLPKQPLLIIMEGVSMYLTESENQALIREISDRLAPAKMILDVLGSKAKDPKSTQKHDTVSQTSAVFQWGTDNPHDIESWAKDIQVVDQICYLPQFAHYPDRLKPRWLKFFRPILIPAFRKKARIIVLQIA